MTTTVPYTFADQGGQIVPASELDANFDALASAINGTYQTDGTILFAHLNTYSIPAPVIEFRSAGYSTNGEGMANYRRTSATTPTTWRQPDASGQMWEISEYELNFEMFGAPYNGSASSPADAWQAISDCFYAADELARCVRPRARWYGLSQTLDLTPYVSVNFDGASQSNVAYSNPADSHWPQLNSTGFIILTDGIDGVRLGCTPVFKNAYIQYKNQQPDSGTNIGLAWNRFLAAQVENVTVSRGCINFGIPQQAFAGAIGGLLATASNGLYECELDNLRSINASQSHFDIRNYLGGGTNVKFGTMYINGGRALGWGSGAVQCQYGIRAYSWSGLEIQALSVDGVDCSVTMFDLNNCHGVNFPTVRFEEGQMTSDLASWIRMTSAEVRIGYMELRNCRSTAALNATNCHLFRITTNPSSLFVGSVKFVGNNSVFARTAITGITNATNGEATTASAHGLIDGQTGVYITGVTGMTGVNGGPYTVTVTADNKFKFGVNTTGSGSYASGGFEYTGPNIAPTPSWRLASIGSGFDGLLTSFDFGNIVEGDGIFTGWNAVGNNNSPWSQDVFYQRPPIRRYCGRVVSELSQGGRGPTTLNYTRYADWTSEGVGASGGNVLLPPSVFDPAGFPWESGDQIIATGAVRAGAPSRWFCTTGTGSVSNGTWAVIEYAGGQLGTTYNADADASILAHNSAWQQVLTVALTADRSWTLLQGRTQAGMIMRIIRTEGSTGSFGLKIYDVDGTTLLATLNDPNGHTAQQVYIDFRFQSNNTWTICGPVTYVPRSGVVG